ncbi:class I SAM-dependent methyltransferase [Ensifer aridi]|uniref:class I SAM-dependent methyltransferase n=1 Tax=Ensifer aridi TaxID=1708715 RepID=UPI00111C63D7|nr:class I SAM-dependent methyltransferase [Ensifer aridi]
MFERGFEALSAGATHLHRKSIIVASEKEALVTIKNALDLLERNVVTPAVDEVRKHCSYLAEKAGLSLSDLLEADTLEVHPQIFADTLHNISVELNSVELHSIDEQKDIVERTIEASGAELEGWCTPEKAHTMAEHIRREKPGICVEIGVYGGRSLFPCAAALKENGHGKIYGIESWSAETAVENATSAVNDAWWASVDFPRIKKGVYTFAARHDLTSQVCIIEASSTKVSHLFDTIDFLHIDGSHSIINAATDVIQYATKVCSGGIIVMDDIEWPSTAPAYQILLSFCDLLQVLKNDQGIPSVAFLRKR